MTERLSNIGIDHHFIEATDGKLLTPEQLSAYAKTRRHLFIGHDLTNGEIGCLLSHRDVYRHMIAHNVACALVLEDDAVLSPDLPAVLNAIEPLITSGKADMVRMLSRKKVYNRSRILGTLTGEYKLARPFGLPGGAYGYVLNLKAARHLNAKMDKNWVPVDTVLGQVWRTRLNVLSVIPSPVSYIVGGPSTIGDARYDKKGQTISWWARALLPLTRLIWKLYEGLCKRLVKAVTLWPDKDLRQPNG